MRTLCALLVLSLVLPARAAVAEPRAEPAPPLVALATQLCDREVVLLGEERTHSAAASMAAKAGLARALVAHCGYSAIVFESAIYDFLHHERQLAAGQADPEVLAGAIGGLWAGTDAFAPLLSYLHSEAASGRLRIGGMDVQLGSATARYAQRELPGELVGPLPPESAERCLRTLGRHHRWEYDERTPFDEAERSRLGDCIEAIGDQLVDTDGTPGTEALRVQLASYRDYLAMLAGQPDARTAGMLRNLLWYRGRWPEGTRIVVWTASVHGALGPTAAGARTPLGGRLREQLGSAVASVGFSALGGAHGRGGDVRELGPAPAGSLEALALADPAADIGVLDHAALRAAGDKPARVLDLASWQRRDWSTLFDALVVVRTERPVDPPANGRDAPR